MKAFVFEIKINLIISQLSPLLT